jgi:hypothetical protein
VILGECGDNPFRKLNGIARGLALIDRHTKFPLPMRRHLSTTARSRTFQAYILKLPARKSRASSALSRCGLPSCSSTAAGGADCEPSPTKSRARQAVQGHRLTYALRRSAQRTPSRRTCLPQGQTSLAVCVAHDPAGAPWLLAVCCAAQPASSTHRAREKLRHEAIGFPRERP